MIKTLDLKNGVIKLPMEIQKKVAGSKAVVEDDYFVIRIELPKKKLLTSKERLKIWQAVRGMWKDRQPDPIKELTELRRQSDRKLPSLKSTNND